jgi:hypothetical protein
MQIERVKVWMWSIIGAALGAVVASVMLWTGPAQPRELQSVSPHAFEQQLINRHDPTRVLVGDIADVVLHPETDEVPLPGQMKGQTQYITYTAYLDSGKRTPDGKPLFRVSPHLMLLQLEQPGQKSVLGELKGLTLRQYLDKLKAQVDKIDTAKNPLAIRFTYKYAWWETPRGAYALYVSGGVIVVGILWPLMLHVLVLMGLARAPEEGFDLANYKPKKTATAAKPSTALTHDEAERIRQLEEELERKLRDGAGPRVAAPAAVAAAPVKQLNATAVEPPKEEVKKPARPKGYGTDQGDYYPTEVHGKSKP